LSKVEPTRSVESTVTVPSGRATVSVGMRGLQTITSLLQGRPGFTNGRRGKALGQMILAAPSKPRQPGVAASRLVLIAAATGMR
jgi:hypothetical protein